MEASAPAAMGALLTAALAAVALLGGLFGWFLLRRGGATEGPRRRDGSLIVPTVGIDFAYWCIDPVVDSLARLGIRPNHVTAFSLYVAALTGLALATGHMMLGCGLLVATGVCDLLDGQLARRHGAGSKAGAFFDSFADRVAEAFVFGGLAYYGAGGLLTWLSLWAIVASLLVSYARARGESLGAAGDIGLMQRPERMALLTVSLFAAPLVALWTEPDAATPVYHVALVGVGLLAALSSATAFRRARSILRALSNDERDIRSRRPTSIFEQHREVQE